MDFIYIRGVNIKHLKYFLLFLILNCVLLSSAQTLQFHNITMGDGLTQSTVNIIAQDSYGFMWIGTVNGLNIYDGTQFKTFFYDSENKTPILGNDISKIIFDGDSAWIATRSGLCLMDVVSKNSAGLISEIILM